MKEITISLLRLEKGKGGIKSRSAPSTLTQFNFFLIVTLYTYTVCFLKMDPSAFADSFPDVNSIKINNSALYFMNLKTSGCGGSG